MHFSSLSQRAVALLLLQGVCDGATLESRRGPRPHSALLRVESPEQTIYDARVAFPHGRRVTLPSGGTHRCDGTNNDANETPGATSLSILYAASKHGGGKPGHTYPDFALDGNWEDSIDDFFITTIGNTTLAGEDEWTVAYNYDFLGYSGPCQIEIFPGSETLWLYNNPDLNFLLQLSGPQFGYPDAPFTVNAMGVDGSGIDPATVVPGTQVMAYDPKTGTPFPNGTSVTVDPDTGDAYITETKPGTYFYKAYHESDSVRSAAIKVIVRPYCSSKSRKRGC